MKWVVGRVSIQARNLHWDGNLFWIEHTQYVEFGG
jgi:hypothetical protein